MKKLFIGIFLIGALFIAAIIALPRLISSDAYKDKIQTQLSKELGRDIVIKGDVSVSVFPVLKAQTGRITIANAAGFQAEHLAQMDGLDARVKLLPLLSRKIEISKFSLLNPVIELEKKADGTANWTFSASENQITDTSTEKRPFKRDGRYQELDPQIGKFSIENASIRYRDAATRTSHTLSNANLGFTLPSLAAPVTLKGDLIFDGTPIDLNILLKSPRSFLDGQLTPVEIYAKTDFAKIDAKGEFLASPELAFNVKLDGNIDDVARIKALLPNDVPNRDYLDLAKTVKIAGNYSYDGTLFTANNAEFSLLGTDLDAHYTGDITLADTPVLNGTLKSNIRNVPKIAKLLDQNIDGIEQIKTLDLSADMKAQGKGFSASNIKADVTGTGILASFKGQGSFADPLSLNGSFTANIDGLPRLLSALKQDIPQAATIEKLDISGTLSLRDKDIAIDISNLKTTSETLQARYVGKVSKTGDIIAAAGNFEADIASMSRLNQLADLKITQADAIGSIASKGLIHYDGNKTSFTDLKVDILDGALNGNFQGSGAYDKAISLNGAFSVDVPSTQALATAAKIDTPYARSIGKLSSSGTLALNGDRFSLTGLNADLKDGQLNGSFSGEVTKTNDISVTGTLEADIPSLRALAKNTGTELPASTPAGAIYERFKIAGRVSGTPQNIVFKDATLAFDEITGTGQFSVKTLSNTPFVNGRLALNGLDLRPYMASYAAQNPTGDIQPWSQTPLNVSMLKVLDGDFKVSTPNIVTDRLSLEKSDITAKLSGGKLTANFPNISLYGGIGNMRATVNAASSVPEIDMTFDLAQLQSNSFLKAVAGFAQITGTAGTQLKITGRGLSQADIMRSLRGGGDFKVLNGKISGVDVSQFVSGIDQALTSRSLPAGLGPTYQTAFRDLIAAITIENGIAKIQNFNLNGPGVSATGGGQMNLGAQSVDFSLRPRLTGDKAKGLAGFGIPIRLQGTFGSIKAGLDTDMLGQIVAERAQARARQEAAKLITKNVGGSAGQILGSVLGTSQPTTASTPSSALPQGTSTPPASTEEAITGLLGGILGGQDQATPNSQTPTTAGSTKANEPSVEDALIGLFGKKKKKKSN